MISKKAKKKTAKKPVCDTTEKEAKDLRSWCVAQLAAQLAVSPHLNHEYQRKGPPLMRSGEAVKPDHPILDLWFESLLHRADWLLVKSAEIQNSRVIIGDLFEPNTLYSYSGMAKILKDAGAGTRWHRTDAVSSRMQKIHDEMVSVYVLKYCELLSNLFVSDCCSTEPTEGMYDGKLSREFKESLRNVLAGDLANQGDLLSKVTECLPGAVKGEADGLDQNLPEGPKSERVASADEGYVFSSKMRSTANDFMGYYWAANLGGKAEGAGAKASKEVDASSMFAFIRAANIDRDLWSFEK